MQHGKGIHFMGGRFDIQTVCTSLQNSVVSLEVWSRDLPKASHAVQT